MGLSMNHSEQIFSQLVQDAIDIADELDDLQKFLRIDAKTETITEYQVFETLYLKRKIASCIEELEKMESEQKDTYSQMISENSKRQFEQFKQIIDLLDMTNRSREMKKVYTEEEAVFIKEWEDRREKRNPDRERYPIQTRLTCEALSTQGKELESYKQRQLKDSLIAGGIIGLMIVFATLKSYGVAVLCIPILVYVIIKKITAYRKQLRASQGDFRIYAKIDHESGNEKNLLIRRLCPAARELRGSIRSYKNRVAEKFDLPDKVQDFLTYDDYEHYVELYLICEKLNPLLFEKGICAVKKQNNEKNKTKWQFFIFKRKAPKKSVLVRQKNGIDKKLQTHKETMRTMGHVKYEKQRGVKNNIYSSTKGVGRNNYNR